MTTTVLVVDDEKKLRSLLREYLEREGYAVLEAADGQMALDLARAARPDLVVLDLGLPGLPGDEVARLLRKDGDLPIVMLTAKASENDRVAGLRLGADDYVVKPFSPRELVARVEAAAMGGCASTPSAAKCAVTARSLSSPAVSSTCSRRWRRGPDGRGHGSSSAAASRATRSTPTSEQLMCT